MVEENVATGLKENRKRALWKWGKLEFQGVSSVRFYLKDQVGKNYQVIFLIYHFTQFITLLTDDLCQCSYVRVESVKGRLQAIGE